MVNIFISYSRKDILFARLLTKALEGEGVDSWIDWDDIPPSMKWWKEIEKGIENSDIFVFLISRDSVSSKVCNQEIDHAAKNGKRLIPVVVRDTPTNKVPEVLRSLNWILLREKDDFKTSFSELLEAIKTDYEWVQTHRRLQVRSLEWERGNKDNSFLLRGIDLQEAEAQLRVNGNKEPRPTELQKLFIQASRQQQSDEEKREEDRKRTKYFTNLLVSFGQMSNSSLGLERVLNEAIDFIISLMRADRGFLMLLDKQGEIQIQAARDVNQLDLNDQYPPISKSIVMRVAETGEPVLTTNAQEDPRSQQQNSVAGHKFRSILCVPLRIKEEIIGVIYVDSRIHPGLFQEDDIETLSAFADQAAIAIDNARMFDKLQQAQAEINEAYENTLKGWALTLELRDRDTEGHTQRVTYLTLVLAKKLGVTDEELEHIKRGALLHDIGKLAIPDSILLKPVELTLPERKFMELHPEIAKDLLEKIEYLHPAMDIPYCHHENWDGTGYPHNLQGEDIPFAARIFAVVDTWDNLTSPQRNGMPCTPEQAREIIRADSGKRFDPQVVDAFLAIQDLPVPPQTDDTQLIQKLR